MVQMISKVYEELRLVEKMGINNLIETNGENKSGSLSFKLDEKGSIVECLIDRFSIPKEEQNLFKGKYEMAISGNGDEGCKDCPQDAKILTLHSSSLLALMNFYNVDIRPIIVSCNGKDIEFNKSFFEYKNKVIGFPSNMDVVLVSEKDNAILFLESKFTEYLKGSKRRDGIGDGYLSNKYSGPIYNDIDSIGLKCDRNSTGFDLTSDKETYLEGIKQMISHYVGVSNFVSKDFYDGNMESLKVEKYLNENTKIYLGTILFKFKDAEFVKAFDNYSQIYEALANKMNDLNQNKQLVVLDEIITYQDFIKSEPYTSIYKFYFE